MSNFSPQLQDMNTDQLQHLVNESNPQFGSLASGELMRRTLNQLNKSLNEGTVQAQRSSKVAEEFTAALFFLTVAQLIVAVLQFILSFAYSENVQVQIFGIVMIIVTAVILLYFGHRIFKKPTPYFEAN